MFGKIKSFFSKLADRHKEAKKIAEEQGLKFGWVPVTAEEVREGETGKGILGLTTKARKKLTKKTPIDLDEIDTDTERETTHHGSFARVSKNGKDYLVKVLNTGERASNRITARKLARDIQEHVNNLKETEMNIPDIHRILAKKKGRGRFDVVSVNDLVGEAKNGEYFLTKSDEDEAVNNFKGMLEQVYKSFKHPKEKETEEFKSFNGIDAHPGNFVKDEETNKFFYVNFFPPRVRDRKGRNKWKRLLEKEEPEILSDGRFDKRRVLQYLVLHSSKCRPELEQEFLDEAKGFLKERGEEKLAEEVEGSYTDFKEKYKSFKGVEKLEELKELEESWR